MYEYMYQCIYYVYTTGFCCRVAFTNFCLDPPNSWNLTRLGFRVWDEGVEGMFRMLQI